MNRTWCSYSCSYCLLQDPWMMHTFFMLSSRSTVHVCDTGESLKRDCCCTVAASKYTASEGWFGTGSRYILLVHSSRPQNEKMAFWGFQWAWSALARRARIPLFLARYHDLERVLWARTGPTLEPWRTCGTPACPTAESTRKPVPGRDKLFKPQKKFVSYTHTSNILRASYVRDASCQL